MQYTQQRIAASYPTYFECSIFAAHHRFAPSFFALASLVAATDTSSLAARFARRAAPTTFARNVPAANTVASFAHSQPKPQSMADIRAAEAAAKAETAAAASATSARKRK